jgi:hypothetical protein
MELDLGTERDNSSRVYLRRVIADFRRRAAGRQIYESADREPGSTDICDLHKIPAEDAISDAALSTHAVPKAPWLCLVKPLTTWIRGIRKSRRVSPKLT